MRQEAGAEPCLFGWHLIDPKARTVANSRMWANPSGTGANMAARATLGLAPLSFVASPYAPLAIGGGLLLSRGLAEVATNPASVKFFASKGGLPDNTQRGLLTNAAQQADEPRRKGLLR